MSRIPRLRKLTLKAKEQYHEALFQYANRLYAAKSEVELLLTDLLEDHETDRLLRITQNLEESMQNYETLSKQYIDFLVHVNSEDSNKELHKHHGFLKTFKSKVYAAVDNVYSKLNNGSSGSADQSDQQTVKNTRNDAESLSSENLSTSKSKSSRQSERTHTSQQSLFIKQRAKLEAAKVRLKYAKQEADLAKQQAILEGERKLLNSSREVEEAEAELKAMSESGDEDRSVSFTNKQQRVFDYIQNVDPLKAELPHQQTIHNPTERPVISTLDPNAHPYIPSSGAVGATKHDIASDLTRFIVKKDLLLSRLTKFEDKAEFFLAWKASFQSIMRDLDVAPHEELDLLVKWLGPESSKQAKSIRLANTENPDLGLRKIWERLGDRFASPEMVESSLKRKLNEFPKLTNKDYGKLFDLSDIVEEIESVKRQNLYQTLFAYYDSSSGVMPIVSKLPTNLQERWTVEATRYKRQHGVPHPPFTFFSQFLLRLAKMKNDPSFTHNELTVSNNKANYSTQSQRVRQPRLEQVVSARVTETTQSNPSNRNTNNNEIHSSSKPQQQNRSSQATCPLHKTSHALNKCRAFRFKPINERKEFLAANKICSRCCGSTPHSAKDCKSTLYCMICKSNNHPTGLHVYADTERNHGGERTPTHDQNPDSVSSSCTQICHRTTGVGKSCAKIIQVIVYPEHSPENRLTAYALIDDQSNRTLGRTQFFDHFGERGLETEYMLSSCMGTVTTSGRQASGYIVEALDNSKFKLPTILECNDIPNIREEIPTPEAARFHPHLEDIAENIPPINEEAEILLLIGRDLPQVHHIQDQRIGLENGPFAHKTGLGWAIIGEVCLGSVHPPDSAVVNCNKTHLLNTGRSSFLKPCTSIVKVKECQDISHIFERTIDDDTPGLSIDDKHFLDIMQNGFMKETDGNWSAPLPLRPNRTPLQCNYSLALHRAKLLHRSLQSNSTKKQHMVDFMSKIINKGHAEVAPPLQQHHESWYLPLFGVYNPRKPDQIRGVFDASAKYMGTSLNDVLYTGPDLTNNLLGILMRFRNGPIGVIADIEQMFYCFRVHKEHRDFLRFIWYKDNDPSEDLIEYRMTVHVFGNSPSPAIATYGLRKAVETADEDVQSLINTSFYVDDVLHATSTPREAIDLMKRTKQSLGEGGNIRLHKIASSSKEVLRAFPSEDLAQDLRDLNFDIDKAPLRKSLGMSWDIDTDTFTFQVSLEDKPFTRRGLLSVVNGLYDPIGFLSPVVIKGKLIFRQLMSTTTDWDEPIPIEHQEEWYKWRESLVALESIRIPRALAFQSTRDVIYIFSDASKDAIAAVAYVKTYDINGQPNLNFLLGKTKVAPSKGHTIPRLELCGAVLAVDLSCIISKELQVPRESFKYFTDSKVILGYIHNEQRRFYVYVENRVEKIRRFSNVQQWHYVPTEINPADQATRSVCPSQMADSLWLKGPQIPLTEGGQSDESDFPLIEPDQDKDIKSVVTSIKTTVQSEKHTFGTHRFQRFSDWKRLVKVISHLRHIVRCFKSCQTPEVCNGWHHCSQYKNPSDRTTAENFIIREVQKEAYPSEIEALRKKEHISRSSSILSLSPYLDRDGILRVGGRLDNSDLSDNECHPIIIPKNHHIALLLIRYFHEQIQHQGRHFTEGAIRSAGFWIVGAKRLICSYVHSCVKCRRLRGKLQYQQMSDLPSDRVRSGPPFSSVGIDVFGPWKVQTRRTRGGVTHNKRWAVMFTCLAIRAVHIEVIEEMTSQSFINALRRFMALRGDIKLIRSDRGTNFVGSTDDLKINTINVEDSLTKDFFYNKGISWVFNPPHAPHMGGAWERLIGQTKRILDAMLLEASNKKLTTETLTTLLAEVANIINARPITSVTSDAQQPEILSPSMILTQKSIQENLFADNLDSKDIYKSTWKHVQFLANKFWKRWRTEYLHTLQTRSKWEQSNRDFQSDDVVLVRDVGCARNSWPLGIVKRTFPSPDGKVRKVEVAVIRDDKKCNYIRPVTELVLLL